MHSLKLEKSRRILRILFIIFIILFILRLTERMANKEASIVTETLSSVKSASFELWSELVSLKNKY